MVNIVSGFGDIGAYLARHPGVDKIAFTGSTEVGYDIMRNSHVSNLKRITLELGGKSPNIITKNANFDKAVAQSCMALFFNAGQCCIAGSRTYVHSSMWRYLAIGDPFIDAFMSRDLDMEIFEREIMAVNEWLGSDKAGHIMRDNPYHRTEILGKIIFKIWQRKFIVYF